MDRSLDEIISERPRARPARDEPRRGPPASRPPPRGSRRDDYPREGVRKPRRDDRVSDNREWVHDMYEEDARPAYRREPEADYPAAPYSRVLEGSEGTRLRVDNLHYELTEDDLRSLFSRMGPLLSVRLMYDRMDRSEGVAYVTYRDHRDARDAITEFDGQNAYGQPIRLGYAPAVPAAARGNGTLFDRVERPARSLFDRIEGGAGDSEPPRDVAGRRRDRSGSPRRRPAGADIERYAPVRRGSRSPLRRRGTARDAGRRPGQRREAGGRAGGRQPKSDEEGHRIMGGRPKKTAAELDAEMEDYWGSKGSEPPPAKDGAGTQNGNAPAAVTAPAGDDVDMIE